ncbi:MAG TPA: carboxypeptidase-like regulatory domain-containing protein [Chryseosolibacter sp.]
MKKTLLLHLFLLITLTGVAQSAFDITLSVKEKTPITQVFDAIQKSHPVRFFYLDEWLTNYSFDESYDGYSLERALTRVLSNSDISFSFMYGYAVVIAKDPAKALDRENILRTAVVQKKNVNEQVIGSPANFKAGQAVKLRGVVKSEVNIPLASASVYVEDINLSVNTDQNGRYELTMPAGEHVMTVRSVNFGDKVVDLKIYESGVLDIQMEEMPIVLEEVEVNDQAILTSRMGQTSLQMKDLKRAPAFLGEVDVIKQIQMQAGVTTVGEVASGFNVRGGSVDQNLVLFDGTPIFNTSHALGFFTAFNSDAVSSVNFYRGGIPAEYGGRVSSVLSITSQEGNKQKWTGSGGIGIISSHLTIGGPIKQDTTTIIASVRASYSDWMLKTIRSNYSNLQNASVAFYDGSMKFSHKFSGRTKLTLSGYTSNDRFTLSNDTIYNWRNIAGSIRVDHSFSDRFYSTVTLDYGKYAYQLEEEDPYNAFKLDYSVTYPSLNLDFNLNGRHEIAFGLHNRLYDFQPGDRRPTHVESNIANTRIPNERSLETAFYITDGFYWRENVFVEAGLRYSLFTRFGPATVYQYLDGASIENRNIVDSTLYGKNEVIKMYHGAEPRLSLRYTLTPNSSLKFGYNRIYQYIHLVTNTAAVTPVDIWQSSNTYFKPQIADQVSLGYYRNLNDNMYETFIEAYYKHVNNTLDFKDGADLILNKNLETALLPGIGQSYGIEVSATKVKGRLVGSANYAFSRSLRTVDGISDSEKINGGQIFASNFDQPHVVNLNWRYNISRRYFLSGNFTYHTGRPLSLPESAYATDGTPISNFSERNRYRIPDYHRMDLALIMEGNHKRKKFWDGTWAFSLYNVYSRKNAYSIFFKSDNSGTLRPYKLSVIGTVIPSLSYTFKI